jgi:Tol biopolymer transport system component
MDVRRNSTSRFDSWGPIGLALAVGLALVWLLAPWPSDAAFPGQNGKIAYDSPLPGGLPFDRQIDLINPDGTGGAPLTPTPVDDVEPAWSPDGTRIAYRCRDATAGETEICVINTNGTGAVAVTDATDPATPANGDSSPAFFGDGNRIAFVRNDGQPEFDDEIWTMNADGSNQVKVTSNTAGDFEPTVNSASTAIAFGREVAGTGQAIFSMAPDGTGEAPLTPTDGSMIAEGPNFSPDGSRLTFARCEEVIEGCGSPLQVVTMSSGGGGMTEVTSPPRGFFDVDPVFSPDGTRIAFARDDFSTSNILAVAAAGGAAQQITFGGDERNPDWQPVEGTPSGSGGAAGAVGGPAKCQGHAVTIPGDRKNNVIRGTRGRDVIHGFRGEDLIFGLRANDRLCGGRGFDKLFGGPGDDILFGGDHRDFLSGGDGEDFLFGGTPTAPIKPIVDVCHGDSGKNRFRNCQKQD